MTSPNAESSAVKRLFRELQLTEKDVNYFKVEPWVLAPGKTSKYELKVGPFRFDAQKYVTLAKPHALTRTMSSKEIVAMKNSIFLNGVQSEIFLDSTGRVLDGYHRVLACAEEMIDERKTNHIPYKVVEFQSSDQEYEYIVIHHMVRRHFRSADKRNVVKVLLLAGHDGTAGFLAEIADLSTNTVKAILEEMLFEKQIVFLEKRRDSRGRYHNQLNAHTRLQGEPVVQALDPTSTQEDASVNTKSTDDSLFELEGGSSLPNTPIAYVFDNRENRWPEKKVTSLNLNQELVKASDTLNAIPEELSLLNLAKPVQVVEQASGSLKDLPIEDSSKPITDAQPTSPIQEQPLKSDTDLMAIPLDNTLSQLEGSIKPDQLNDDANSEVEAIAKLWWETFGVIPVSAQDLQTILEKNSSDVLQTYRSGNVWSLGKALKKMTDSKDGRFLVLYKQVGSGSIYYLRPRSWSIHGPQ